MSQQESQPQRKSTKKLSERYLRNAGEYYLSRHPASSAHFMTVMTRKIDRSCKDHPDQNREEWIAHVRDTLIPAFSELGFLNDDLYAAGVFQSLARRGHSKAKIRQTMMKKSIAPDLVSQQLEEYDFKDQDAVMIFARKKKIGQFRATPYTDIKEKQKDLGKLARAGFSYALAMSVFE